MLFFAANDIMADSRQKAIFFTTCGAATYGLFRSLASPDKPADISLMQLWEGAAAHYHPKPSRAVQRLRFNSRVCQPGESVAMYLAELKSLSEHCDFGDALDDMLRDRIVCGIQDQRTQPRLLAETDLTFKRVFEVAQAIESADTQVEELQLSCQSKVHAVGPQFRAQVPQSALVEDRPSTPTRRDSPFAHLPHTPPTAHHSSRTPSHRATPQR